MSEHPHVAQEHPYVEERVTPLELFFDLVFVLAITQVTAFMATHATWVGIGRGLLLLGTVWWAWVGYAWLTNSLDAESTLVRTALLSATLAMFVVALALPGAFGENAVIFTVAFLCVRILHIVLYWLGSRDDPELRGAVGRLTGAMLLPPLALIALTQVDEPLRTGLWAVVLTADYLGPVVSGTDGWTVHPRHFVERHGLILIIALGESIVALGLATGTPASLSAETLVVAIAGVVCVVALWWSYFDVAIIVAERKLAEATGAARAAMARDSYSYLHLPMIAGIVLLALGLKQAGGNLHEPLGEIGSWALYGGPALYLLGHAAFRLRNTRTVSYRRLSTAGALMAGAEVLGGRLDALVSVLVVAGTLTLLLSYEVIRFRDVRARIRTTVQGAS